MRKYQSQAGSSFIIIVVLAAIMFYMGCSFLLVATNTFINGISSLKNSNAFQSAESGMLVGVSWLKQQTNLPNNSLQDVFKNNPLKINGMNVTVDVIVDGAFNYRTFEVQSTAQSPSLFYKKRVCTKLNLIPPVFRHGIFGDKGIIMTGNGATDSYDSDIGLYDPLHSGVNGDIATNSTDTGAITISGNATVNGDAETGPSGTVEMGNNASITGNISHESNRALPKVEVPSYLKNLINSGEIKLSGNNSMNLSDGNYKYSNIDLSGNTQLNINGDAKLYLNSFKISGNAKLIISAGSKLTIYLDGSCDIGGNGILNQSNIPANCLILSTCDMDGEGIKITGNGDFHGAVYAPQTTIKISGNGELFGSFAGKSVFIPGNGNIHYDEALSRIGLPYISLKEKPGSWKELNFI